MNVSSLSRHIDVLPVTGKIAAETDKALRRPTRTSTRPVGGGAARSNAAWQASTASNWTPRRPIRDRWGGPRSHHPHQGRRRRSVSVEHPRVLGGGGGGGSAAVV